MEGMKYPHDKHEVKAWLKHGAQFGLKIDVQRDQ